MNGIISAIREQQFNYLKTGSFNLDNTEISELMSQLKEAESFQDKALSELDSITCEVDTFQKEIVKNDAIFHQLADLLQERCPDIDISDILTEWKSSQESLSYNLYEIETCIDNITAKQFETIGESLFN